MNQLAGQTLGSPPRGYPGGKSAVPFLAKYESERSRLGISARSISFACAGRSGSSWTGATVLVAPAELSDQAPVDLLRVMISPGVAVAARSGLANGERP
jgi:hypothetical protein